MASGVGVILRSLPCRGFSSPFEPSFREEEGDFFWLRVRIVLPAKWLCPTDLSLAESGCSVLHALEIKSPAWLRYALGKQASAGGFPLSQRWS